MGPVLLAFLCVFLHNETFAQSIHQDEMAKISLLFVGKLGNS
jgi:hypothetical protein